MLLIMKNADYAAHFYYSRQVQIPTTGLFAYVYMLLFTAENDLWSVSVHWVRAIALHLAIICPISQFEQNTELPFVWNIKLTEFEGGAVGVFQSGGFCPVL